MPTPAKAELQHALSELRLAAEALKTYDAVAADRLHAAIERHGAVVKSAAGLSGDTASLHRRLVELLATVTACVERTRNYPTQILARADLLDRASGLAKTARLLLDKLAPPVTR